jgi:Reverse transcriptase (RNA-dependent DNA polymerase)/Endonuclease-reverse transcriptase
VIGSAYRAPSLTADQNKNFLNSLDQVANKMHEYDGVILMGDFNLDIDWKTDPPTTNKAPAAEFQAKFSEMSLSQLIRGPTRTTKTGGKTLDLVLTDVPQIFNGAKIVSGVSDHDALLTDLALNVVRPTRPPKTVFNFGRADWESLSVDFARSLPNNFQETNINDAWKNWSSKFFDCLKRNVPTKTVKERVKTIPWLTKTLKKMIAKRNRLFSKWLKNQTPETRERYVEMRKKVIRALRNAKDEFMWKLGSGPNGSKFFWSHIKERSKVPISNSAFVDGGKTISQPQEIASLFAEKFQSNFSQPTDTFPYMRRRAPNNAQERVPNKITEIKISAGEVKILLDALKQNSATGPDKIPAIVLKRCSDALSSSLASLFSLSLSSGALAHEWKTANVMPIYKDGDKADVQNYRPISVTSIVGKLLEKHVRNKTVEFLDREKIIPDNQHGFRSGRSCTTLLLKTIDEWTAILDAKSGTHIHTAFLDWSKAFDKVPHERLLSKLEYYGIEGNLLIWFRNFLTGRIQNVVFRGAKSEPKNVISGVIQGSVLGPLLFNIFVADLPSCIKHSNLKQYADDCSLSKEIKNDTDSNKFQEDLDSVDVWCAVNGMQLNARKCKIMDITHARTVRHNAYTIGGRQLEYVNTERLLGVHVSKDLKWNYHTDLVRKKSSQILGFARRNLKGCTPRVKRMAYLTLVKPILYYSSPAWHPETKTNIDKMERVQNRALRFIHGSHLPPAAQQKIMPVQMQLLYNDLHFFKKCETGDIDCNVRERLVERRALRSKSQNVSIHPQLQPAVPPRNKFGEMAFSNRVVAPWNNLPDPLKDCSSSQFPTLCKAYLRQNFSV